MRTQKSIKNSGTQEKMTTEKQQQQWREKKKFRGRREWVLQNRVMGTALNSIFERSALAQRQCNKNLGNFIIVSIYVIWWIVLCFGMPALPCPHDECRLFRKCEQIALPYICCSRSTSEEKCDAVYVCRNHLFFHALRVALIRSLPLFRVNKNGDIVSTTTTDVYMRVISIFPFGIAVFFFIQVSTSTPNQVRFHHSSSTSSIYVFFSALSLVFLYSFW